MPGSKRNISRKHIEQEIYKTFEIIQKQKNISIADFLNRLELSLFNKQYRKIKFPYKSLVKLVLFQKLKGIKFHTKLTKYLRRNPKDKFKLGFSETPDRTQIGYFVNHILDEQTIELIDFIVKRIEEISEKYGIIFDIKTLEPEKPQRDTKERNQVILKDKKIKEICRLFKRRFTPFINLHLNHNTQYKKKTFIDLILYLAVNQAFAEEGAKILVKLRARTTSQ